MSNLMELALEATRSNVVKSTTRKSVNDSMLELLFEKKQKLTRVEIVTHISLERLVDKYGEEKVEKEWDKLKEEFKDINKTVKNGVDTGISRSKNNSSFHYNEKYAEYKLDCIGDKYEIKKIK